MLKKYPQFSFGFAIIFFAELFAITHQLKELRMVSKPLITITLILFLYFTMRHSSRVTKRVITGMVFSLFGDVFLMMAPIKFDPFVFGLTAFLLAHLCYISAFYLDVSNKINIQKRFPLPIFLVFGFVALFFFGLLVPYLGAMKIPVLIYILVITLMGIMAALRYGKTNYNSFLWVFIGACLFMISDGVLAYNKFVESFETSGIIVMSTYMMAQFLIAMGCVERKFVKKN